MSIIIKMSQVVDQFDQAQSPTPPEEEYKVEYDPLPVEPDNSAESLAKAWQGDMVRVAPNLYLEHRTIDQLNMLKALGFSLSSKDEVMALASLLKDNSTLDEDVNWFNDSEWAGLIKFLVSGKAANLSQIMNIRMANAVAPLSISGAIIRAQVNDDQPLQLLHALSDANFVVDINEPSTFKALQMLAKAPGSPYSQVASAILNLPDDKKQALFSQFSGEFNEEYFKDVPKSVDQEPVQGQPPDVSDAPADAGGAPVVDDSAELDDSLLDEMENALGQSPDAPAVDTGERNWIGTQRSTDRQQGEFKSNFGSIVKDPRNQSVLKSIPNAEIMKTGEPTGLMIQDVNAKKNNYNVRAGDFVISKSFGNSPAMVVGKDGANLVVATFPGGTIQSGVEWDPTKYVIERSRVRTKEVQ